MTSLEFNVCSDCYENVSSLEQLSVRTRLMGEEEIVISRTKENRRLASPRFKETRK